MIGVVGLGYVGLTAALGFAHKGHKVLGYEHDPKRQGSLLKGRVPFSEPYLQEHLQRYQGSGFDIVRDMGTLIQRSQFVFFCVGTPSDASGAVDLGGLRRAVQEALKAVPKGTKKVFIIKSSTPPSTAQGVILTWIKEHGLTPGEDVSLVSNPEFLREGSAWHDFIHAERVVLGADQPAASRRVAALYKSFKVPVHEVSLTTAEFAKYLSNCFLASMISFSNEMAMLAERFPGVDVAKVFGILHEDKRWQGKPAGMREYVYPGCGFGGYCLPKDTQAIYRVASKKKQSMPLLKATIETNRRVKTYFINRVIAALKPRQTLAVLGLSFKPKSDDVRGSVAYEIIKEIVRKKRNRVIVHDPMALDNFKAMYRFPVDHEKDLKAAVKKAHVIVILTAWPEFKRDQHLFSGKNVIDARYYLGR